MNRQFSGFFLEGREISGIFRLIVAFSMKKLDIWVRFVYNILVIYIMRMKKYNRIPWYKLCLIDTENPGKEVR